MHSSTRTSLQLFKAEPPLLRCSWSVSHTGSLLVLRGVFCLSGSGNPPTESRRRYHQLSRARRARAPQTESSHAVDAGGGRGGGGGGVKCGLPLAASFAGFWLRGWWTAGGPSEGFLTSRWANPSLSKTRDVRVIGLQSLRSLMSLRSLSPLFFLIL